MNDFPEATHVRGRWRRRAHRAGAVALGVLATAVALTWCWRGLDALWPMLPELRYVQAVSALSALALVVFTLGLAWGAATERA